MSDVTIHIDETLDSSAIEVIQQELCKIAGIEKINSQQQRPHLMVVSYDRKMMNSESILSKFINQGLHAELIGF